MAKSAAQSHDVEEPTPKPRNPQDTTFRNVRASHKRDEAQDDFAVKLALAIQALEARVERLERTARIPRGR